MFDLRVIWGSRQTVHVRTTLAATASYQCIDWKAWHQRNMVNFDAQYFRNSIDAERFAIQPCERLTTMKHVPCELKACHRV